MASPIAPTVHRVPKTVLRPDIFIKRVEARILLIRGQKVMVDADLAGLYGASTKRLNEQVKRNRHRFPADFMFKLTAEEKAEVVANCDHLRRLKFSPVLPYAFTEHRNQGLRHPRSPQGAPQSPQSANS